MEQQQKILTFWDHLEELRHVLFRIAVAVVFLMLVAFLFKDELFAIVLAPKNADFIIYRFFCRIADFMAMPSLCPEVFYVKMINTQLAAQFIPSLKLLTPLPNPFISSGIFFPPKNKRTINAMNNISCIPNPKNNNVPVILSINY